MSDGPIVTPGPPKGSGSRAHWVVIAIVAVVLVTALGALAAVLIVLRA